MSGTLEERPVELAPSATLTLVPSLIRIVCGFGGLFALTLGLATIFFAPMGRGLFTEGWGYLFSAVGVALLLFHAIRDGDIEVRRVYGFLGALLLIIAVAVGIYPVTPPDSTVAVFGGMLLPWGALAGVLSLLFLINFARHETAEPLAEWVRMALPAMGGSLAILAVLLGILKPDALAGSGVVLGVLGLGFLCGYFSVTDTSVGIPYWAAVGFGVLGAVACTYAAAQSIFPTVLFNGPSALLSASKKLDSWSVFGRAIVIVLGLCSLLVFRAKSLPQLPKYAIAGVGLLFALVFLIGSFTAMGVVPPKPYFIPGGLLLFLLGAFYLAVSLGVTLDTPIVVLTRRELASFFYSPIAYIVLLGNALIAVVSYLLLLGTLFAGSETVPEPIVRAYWALTMGAAFTAPILVAAITMRSFSEEKRSNTIEVLLTAPVNDSDVVFSKFIASLLFFMACWIPSGVFLLFLRYVGGQPFDFRPLLSYYLAMLACGCSFIGIGLFFSALTKNQIVAAVMTFASLFVMLLTILRENFENFIGAGVRSALAKFDYFTLWSTALSGQLLVPEVMVQLSLGALFLFLTVKVLESRKWS